MTRKANYRADGDAKLMRKHCKVIEEVGPSKRSGKSYSLWITLRVRALSIFSSLTLHPPGPLDRMVILLLVPFPLSSLQADELLLEQLELRKQVMIMTTMILHRAYVTRRGKLIAATGDCSSPGSAHPPCKRSAVQTHAR